MKCWITKSFRALIRFLVLSTCSFQIELMDLSHWVNGMAAPLIWSNLQHPPFPGTWTTAHSDEILISTPQQGFFLASLSSQSFYFPWGFTDVKLYDKKYMKIFETKIFFTFKKGQVIYHIKLKHRIQFCPHYVNGSYKLNWTLSVTFSKEIF